MDMTVLAYATVSLSLFVTAIKFGDWILHADPRTIINIGRRGLIAFVILSPAILLWLIASGRWMSAMMLAVFTLPVLVQIAPRWRVLFARLKVASSRVPGFGFVSSSAATGREPAEPELVRQSIAVLKAYLEQSGQPDTVRQTAAKSGPGNAFPPRTRMSADEAHDVLGLNPPADIRDIIEAHRRLEEKVNPESGGTHFLKMKIDEARDVLLRAQSGLT